MTGSLTLYFLSFSLSYISLPKPPPVIESLSCSNIFSGSLLKYKNKPHLLCLTINKLVLTLSSINRSEYPQLVASTPNRLVSSLHLNMSYVFFFPFQELHTRFFFNGTYFIFLSTYQSLKWSYNSFSKSGLCLGGGGQVRGVII